MRRSGGERFVVWSFGLFVAWSLGRFAELPLRSAVSDVQRAIPEALLIEAGPDYVGLTEIAELLGISRQAMRKTMAKNIETFPLPVHEGNPSLWHLKDVLMWMREEQGRAVDVRVEEVSVVACRVNLGRGRWRLEGVARSRFLWRFMA